jgi:RNA exonuclease 1
LADIQSRLLSILTPRAIVVGHSLNSDLDALKMTHPYIVDTSIVFQHPRGPPLKSSLKWLSQRYIGREIQKGHGSTGHDSIEDAKACLDLVRKKCEKGLKWATAEVTSESIFKRLDRVPKKGSASQHANKKGAIIDHGHPERNFGTMASFCLGCKDDEDVVAGVKRAVLGDEDGAVIPGGGVEFTWARLRELETLRGWSNNNRQSLCPNNGEQPGAARNGPAPAVLDAAVARTIGHIVAIREFLPPCTLLIVYSGTGDPREMVRMQEMQRTFREEYKVKKWDELSVKWTDTEEQALRRGCAVARRGVGFICVA